MSIDWKTLLQSTPARVEYENHSFGQSTPAIDMDLTLISLPDHRHIDVSWNDEKGCYLVRLFENDFEACLVRHECSTVEEVIAEVCSLVDTDKVTGTLVGVKVQ
jgi:hypothetical protein